MLYSSGNALSFEQIPTHLQNHWGHSGLPLYITIRPKVNQNLAPTLYVRAAPVRDFDRVSIELDYFWLAFARYNFNESESL